MKEIKAYQCDYCNKYYKHKSSAKRHENKCFKNPSNKACLTCGNFVTDYETVYVPPRGDQNYGDADYEQRYNYCDYDGLTFGHEETNKPFEHNCKYWIPIAIEEEEDW